MNALNSFLDSVARMQRPMKNAADHSRESRGTALFLGTLGISQVIAVTICVYFVVTRGEDRATFMSAIIALLLMVLSITFKVTRRFPRK
jgi:hypothetical protein